AVVPLVMPASLPWALWFAVPPPLAPRTVCIVLTPKSPPFVSSSPQRSPPFVSSSPQRSPPFVSSSPQRSPPFVSSSPPDPLSLRERGNERLPSESLPQQSLDVRASDVAVPDADHAIPRGLKKCGARVIVGPSIARVVNVTFE